jgi:multiple sugar transport system ATP-binding protein
MGGAIVRQPQAFLMDEPLSNLDAKLRVQMRAEIGRLQNELETTTIYVTHDQVEAMTMGDRVAVMRKGELQQVAPPQELYDRPLNLFVGGFIGSPAMNMVEARLERSDGHMTAKVGSHQLTLDDKVLSGRPALAQYAGRDVVIGIRPEHLEDASVADGGADGGRRLKGEVELTEALGSELMVHFAVDARPALTEDVKELAQDAGGDLAMEEAEHATGRATIVGRFDARSRVREGQTAEVAVDTASLHFFDPETGLAIYDGDTTKGAGS